MKATAPGTVSSVRPARALGALARKEVLLGIIAGGGECTFVGDAVHVQSGDVASPIEPPPLCLAPRDVDGMGCFRSVFRHDSISSSFIGETPRLNARRLRYRQIRNKTKTTKTRPIEPRTEDKTITKVRR